MLEDGKLVCVRAALLEETLEQVRLHLDTAQCRWPLDGFAQLVSRHSRHKVLAFVEHLGQSDEVRTFTEIVGTHCDDDVHSVCRLVLLHRRKQETDELGCLARTRTEVALEAEDLLELIDDDEEVLLRLPSEPPGIDEPEVSGAQDVQAPFELAKNVVIVEGRGQRTERIGPRSHNSDTPSRPGTAQVTATQGRQQAGTYQGRLPAARQTDNRQEARVVETTQQGVGLLIAPEEEHRVLLLEGAEPRKDALGQNASDRRHYRFALNAAFARTLIASIKGPRSLISGSPVVSIVSIVQCGSVSRARTSSEPRWGRPAK